MNYGPLLFLAAFFALASSWFGLVLSPQIQVGRLQQTNTLGNATYPVPRPGLARQGLEVYRANGCADCHSQQLGQTATICAIVLTEVGTNRPAVIAALLKLGVNDAEVSQLLASLPKPVLPAVSPVEIDPAIKALAAAGAKATLTINATGPDIARGWGLRRTVAADFLYDNPVLLGSQRIGPDLADLGVRQPDANWHLQHLYAPRSKVNGSAMPTYRFLFETRKIGRAPSPLALALPPEFAPPAGFEVVPTHDAQSLVAYLLSLRADSPLYEAPLTVAVAATPAPASPATGPAPPTVAPAPK